MKVGKIIYEINYFDEVVPYMVAKIDEGGDDIYLINLDINCRNINRCYWIKLENIKFDCFESKDAESLTYIPEITREYDEKKVDKYFKWRDNQEDKAQKKWEKEEAERDKKLEEEKKDI